MSRGRCPCHLPRTFATAVSFPSSGVAWRPVATGERRGRDRGGPGDRLAEATSSAGPTGLDPMRTASFTCLSERRRDT